MRCSDCGRKRNPLEPREPSYEGQPIGIYLTDYWDAAASFAISQSLVSYAGAFMKLVYFNEEGNRLKIPIGLDTNWVSHPLTKSQSQSQFYTIIDDLTSSMGPLGPLWMGLISPSLLASGRAGQDWSNRKFGPARGVDSGVPPVNYTTFGVLVPIIFEINVGGLSLEIDPVPPPDSKIGMFYATEEISFDRIVSISSVTLGDPRAQGRNSALQIADHKAPSLKYTQLLYQGLPAEMTLYHGTTIMAALSAFPQLEELLNLPSELKNHWYYLQLRNLMEFDIRRP